MKLAPVARSLDKLGVPHVLVHTGQHYDPGMSDSFFEDLEIPRPSHNLGVGSGTHAEQTAAVMCGFEPVLNAVNPSLVLVYGDVNSTVAAALVAAKGGIKVGHVEAGLRSGDWSMPEEINRVVTDRLSDLLFAPSPDAVENLLAEGIPASRLHFVGNVMIDTLVSVLPRAKGLNVPSLYDVEQGQYALVTLHRPANVDDPETLVQLLEALEELSRSTVVLFAVHPRTRDRMKSSNWRQKSNGLRLVEPMPYVEMLGLVAAAKVVVTDSGGLQEETTYLGVPCVTVRPNTERPITCEKGTNVLVPPDRLAILRQVSEAESRAHRQVTPIEKWDGKAAQRIIDVILRVS